MGIASAIGFAIIGYAIAGAGVYAATQLSKKGDAPKDTDPTILPTAPTEAEATPEQKARIRRKTKTILTGPLTGEEEFGTPPPTLLGSGDVRKKETVG